MVSDLISRKALLELYEGLDGQGLKVPVEVVVQNIKDIPTVDRWIPCSEKMPKDESVPYWTTHEDGSIVMHWYSKECGFTFNWEVEDLEKRKRQGRVIAWMPILLPEPYKAGDIDG